MGVCQICEAESRLISGEVGVCLACIRKRPDEAMHVAAKAHKRSREPFGLPDEPPRDPDGIPCNICVNQCRIPDGGVGYCGVRRNIGGKLEGVSAKRGKLSWYHDPLPTNCVGDWVCPGGTGAGYPVYAHTEGPEYGYKNLAVFFQACSFNCLYCQNWHFKYETFSRETATVDELVAAVDAQTSCICYFGGDPTPQLPFSLKASRQALEVRGKGILRICWETNGFMHKGLLDNMIDIAAASGGCIKFDLKAWDENLHRVLTGVTNRRTLENLQRAVGQMRRRPSPPLVIASTLLVPGYIDEEEIRALAKFIASLNPDIPYSLLGFYPHFHMSDLPGTSKALAERCVEAARAAGIKNVHLGNIHLLT